MCLALACEQDPEHRARRRWREVAGSEAAQADAYPQAADDPPNTCRYGGGRFELTQRGVLFAGTDHEGNQKAPVWVCSPLGVIAKTRDSKSGEWGRLLEWFDDDDVRHQWAMPLELLEGDGTDVRRELARLGLHIATGRSARDLLAAYIKVWPVDQRARCVERLGWHGAVYTLPSETIGDAGELVVFQNAHAIEPAFATVGTAQEWRDSVAALAAGNTRVVFAVCTAFAGALVGMVGEDSGGFHLRGKSSCGKSTALKAAASVWGDPLTYARAWRATANGLESLASLHNDGLLILDELSQCDPKEAGEAAYLLANGQGKARAHRNGTARASLRWRLLFLSAGEESLATLIARTGRKANAGQEVRLADFDADAGAGLGAFETLNGCDSPAALSLALKDAATRHHGVAGLVWLRAVVNDRDKLADNITGGVRQFVAENTPPDAAGQVLRVAQRFGLVAVAGELATHYGVTGWVEGEATQAASRCFAAWLDSFGGAGNREDRLLLAQVRGFFETHGASRFEDVGASIDQRVINRAGFYRAGMEGTREFLVLPEAFKRDVCAGFDLKAATQCLLAQGWIVPGSDGRPTQKAPLAWHRHGAGVRLHEQVGRRRLKLVAGTTRDTGHHSRFVPRSSIWPPRHAALAPMAIAAASRFIGLSPCPRARGAPDGASADGARGVRAWGRSRCTVCEFDARGARHLGLSPLRQVVCPAKLGQFARRHYWLAPRSDDAVGAGFGLGRALRDCSS
jgi:uncharacterized protein (DUF927 family)